MCVCACVCVMNSNIMSLIICLPALFPQSSALYNEKISTYLREKLLMKVLGLVSLEM